MSGVLIALLNDTVVENGSPFVRCAVAEVSVTTGRAASPRAPVIVTTAEPGEPTRYPAPGASDATTCRSDWMVSVASVSSWSVAVV